MFQVNMVFTSHILRPGLLMDNDDIERYEEAERSGNVGRHISTLFVGFLILSLRERVDNFKLALRARGMETRAFWPLFCF